MAIINTLKDLDINVTIQSKYVTTLSAIYNNRFIQRTYVGMTYKKALKKFEEDLRKGKI